jgi:hypothetical protein
MIVGAPKAGTTSLKAWLGQHPDVATHAVREFVYFASDEAFARGYDTAFRTQFGARAASAPARVAKSVAMMYSREALLRLAAHNPAVHVVLVLREPLARAHSEFWYAKRRGRETAATFTEVIDRAVGAAAEDARDHHAYLARSCYARHVEAILEIFGSGRVTVLMLEDLEQDPRSACRMLFAKLPGIDADIALPEAVRHNEAAAPRSRLLLELVAWARRQRLLRALLGAPARRRLHAALVGLNEARFEIPPLDEATRTRLAAYFEPWNARLEAQLGRRLDCWREVSRSRAGTA